jgi:hypothetical protein
MPSWVCDPEAKKFLSIFEDKPLGSKKCRIKVTGLCAILGAVRFLRADGVSPAVAPHGPRRGVVATAVPAPSVRVDNEDCKRFHGMSPISRESE